jgi:hypothetical protein
MSHLAALVRTPVDSKVFALVYAQRLRRTIGYLLLLVTLSTLAMGARVAIVVHRQIEKLLPEVDKIPTVTIRNGEASVNVRQPWVKVIGEEDGKDLVLIIDTTGTLDDFGERQFGLFLQKHALRAKGPDGEQRAFSLARVPDMEIGPTLVKRWLARARWMVPLAIGAAAFVWFCFAKTMQAMLLILVALLATTRRKRPLSFGQLFTVGVYALGPAVLADCVTWIVPLGGFLALYIVLAIGYAVIGARRIPDEPPLTLV